MNLSKKLEQRKQKTLANPPTSVQLPGGVVLKQLSFRILSTDRDGRPLTFEVARGNEDSDCVFWGLPEFLDQPLPSHLRERYQARIEASIEGPDLITESRNYTKKEFEAITKLVDDARSCCARHDHGDGTHDLDCHQGPNPPKEAVTCGYEPCDGGPCLREEEHAERERTFPGPAHAPGHE